MAEYVTTIGLEVHAQLLTASKMFCGCPSATGGAASIPPNSQVCPICLGMPGVLPVVNHHAIELVLLTGLALHCEIAPFSKFDRKNYPYPDLVKGYQISQYDLPLCREGWLEIAKPDGSKKQLGIIRVHAEEDTARLLHIGSNGGSYTLVDVNRSGVPLMEIVGAPDISSPDEAVEYLTAVREILVYIGASSGNMEEGSFRCDANVSVCPVGQDEYGTKVEIKNMNSFKAVRQALEYEVERQIALLESGGRVAQETRGWNDEQRITVGQRSKEQAHDYRYFPEPDLTPLTFSQDDVARIRALLPELPAARRERFLTQLGLAADAADELTRSRPLADYYESAVAVFVGPEGDESKRQDRVRSIANVLRNVVFPYMNEAGIEQVPIGAAVLAELTALIDEKTITMAQARTMLPELIKSNIKPRELVAQLGLAKLSDTDALETLVDQAITENPKAVADYIGGKEAALKSFFGPIMKASKGRADSALVQELLKRKLDALRAAQ